MSDVAAFLGETQIYFGKDYTDDQLGFIRDRLFTKKFSRQAYIDALKEVEKIEGPFLPPPKDLIAIVERCQFALQPKETKQPLPESSKLQAKMAMKLISMITDGKATRGQIVDAYKKAEETKPGTGWLDCLIGKGSPTHPEGLETYYKRCGLSLDKTPRNVLSFDL